MAVVVMALFLAITATLVLFSATPTLSGTEYSYNCELIILGVR